MNLKPTFLCIKSLFSAENLFLISFILKSAQFLFPGSSVVEQLAVNQSVVGSNPTPGASRVLGICHELIFRAIGGYPDWSGRPFQSDPGSQ